MMKFIGAAELEEVGGKPSGKLGSSYSEIHKLVAKLDDLETTGIYLNKKHQELTFKLERKIADYLKSGGHSGGVLAEKKRREIKAVAELSVLMQDQVQKAKIGELLDKMARDSTILISRTANGWIGLFTRRTVGLSFGAEGNVNAFVTKTNLAINPGLFWASERLSIGLLVHEYHHYLTGRNGALYPDEFVAHWKQYLAMKLSRDKFAKINPFLLDDPTGYRLRGVVRQVFAGPEDAGPVWSRYPNN